MNLAALDRLGVRPEETVIVEDNENGVKAATAAGAHVLVVEGPDDVTLDAIRSRIALAENTERRLAA
jgi:beta-phosphoglucomutase-like phosphatase (HAD superfamily)